MGLTPADAVELYWGIAAPQKGNSEQFLGGGIQYFIPKVDRSRVDFLKNIK